MEIYDYILELEKRAKSASAAMNTASDETRRAVLLDLADRVEAASADILAANALDLAAAADNGVPTPMLDRLRLTDARLSGICLLYTSDAVRHGVSPLLVGSECGRRRPHRRAPRAARRGRHDL